MTINDQFKGIAIFVQAASSTSFTQAAERLGITTSAVGKSIARLEARLGARLFYRTTRQFTLTEDGQAFLESCRLAIGELDNAQLALASRVGTPSGRLRIDLPVAFGRQYIMPALFELVDRFPMLELEVSFNNRFIDLIDEGVDLVVRIGELSDSTFLVSRKLMKYRMVVCGSADYLRRYSIPASLDDLALHECVAQGRGGIETPWTFTDLDGTQRTVRPHGRLQFSNIDIIADAVRSGRGLAQLPTWLVSDDLRSGQLTEVLGTFAGPYMPIQAVWPRTRHLNPKIRVLIDQLVQYFARDGR